MEKSLGLSTPQKDRTGIYHYTWGWTVDFPAKKNRQKTDVFEHCYAPQMPREGMFSMISIFIET